LEVTAYDRTGTTKLSVGKLQTLDNQIDTTTGTVKLRAQFTNEDDSLFPNQFVNVRLLVDTLRDVTVMPTSAIQRGAPGTFVYLINPDSTVTVKTVDLGPQSGERVSVRSGLSPGDRVVIDGADKLRNGAKVVVRESPAGGQGRPAAAPGAQAPPATGAPAGATAPAKDAAPPAAAPSGKPDATAAPTGAGDSAPRRSRAP
jgi:multidrug efflux system membrane fusion protein